MYTYAIAVLVVGAGAALLLIAYRGAATKITRGVVVCALILWAALQLMALREQRAIGREIADITAQVSVLKVDIRSGRQFSGAELEDRQRKLKALDDRLTALRR